MTITEQTPAPPVVPESGYAIWHPGSSYLNDAQLNQLLAGINEVRVSRRDGQSHLEAYDVRAHLNRIFGFARWDGEVIDSWLLFEEIDGEKVWDENKTDSQGRKKPGWRDNRRITVGYRVRYRLIVRAPDGTELARYAEEATGDGPNFPGFKRADAHDFAIKTAESQALKRCAINLGDQFGLSLYAKGSVRPLVLRTLVGMPAGDAAPGRVDEGTQAVVPEVPEGVDPVTGEAAPDYPHEPNPGNSQAPHPPTAQRPAAAPADSTEPARGSVQATKTPDEICAIIVHALTVEELDAIDRRLIETNQDGVEVGEYTLAQYVQGKRDMLADAARAAKGGGPASVHEAAGAALAGGKTPPTGREAPPAEEPVIGRLEHPDPPADCKANPARRGVITALTGTGYDPDRLAALFGQPLEQVATKRLRDLIPVLAAQSRSKAERERGASA